MTFLFLTIVAVLIILSLRDNNDIEEVEYNDNHEYEEYLSDDEK